MKTPYAELLENRDCWRDEARTSWKEVERLEILIDETTQQRDELIEDVKHEAARAAQAIAEKESLANKLEVCRRSLEFFQLRCINLQRREDGLEGYKTTEQALKDFFGNGDYLDKGAERPTLFGFPLIISDEEPRSGECLSTTFTPYASEQEVSRETSPKGVPFFIQTTDGELVKLGEKVVENLGDDNEDSGNYYGISEGFGGTLELTLDGEEAAALFDTIMGDTTERQDSRRRTKRYLSGVRNLERWDRKANHRRRAKLWR